MNDKQVGQTGSGKTSFVQSLDKNKIFGDRLISVDLVSKINLTKVEKMKLENVLDTQMKNFTIMRFTRL